MAKPIRPVEPPDLHYLKAAEGWLDLGNPTEAKIEIEQISPLYSTHPEVLKMQWLIWARLQQWDAAYTVARALIQVAPELPCGWVYLSYTVRRLPMGGLEKALNILLPVAAHFPDETIIAYNLAYYSCKLGKIDEARNWLAKAVKADPAHKIRQMALEEPGLRPLWHEIQRDPRNR